MEIFGGRIIISSPLLRKRLTVGHAVAALLISARRGLAPPTDDASRATVAMLLETGFLVEVVPAETGRDADGEATAQYPSGTEAVSPWKEWGPLAWSFHTRTRDVPFLGPDPVEVGTYQEKIMERPRPSSVRAPISDRVLLLPRVRSALDAPYRRVLEDRRTHRDFAEHELDLDAFSDMLHYSFAPLRFADAGPMGVLQLRASASGGARHETEAFVFVFNVAGVQPGLYHYDNIRHGLEPLRTDVGRDELEHLTNEQGFFRRSSFGVLTVAVGDRMSWKYLHPHTYRMLLHNVGHVAQVFSMTAAALGLGAAMTGALRDSEADRLLGLDHPREFTTFALACGLPVRGPGGMPRAVRIPRVAPEYY
jgi:SagB-type dehydrogenase family enzyme